jgi:hypothetical protein
MEQVAPILNNLNVYFNNNNINFVIGGGYAINLLSKIANVDNVFNINNLDVFYMANTPITPQYIHTYRRVQDSPRSSTTYITENGFNINLTMIRSNYIRCVKYNNFNVMLPMKLYSYYEDVINPSEIQITKMQYLKFLDTVISKNIIRVEYKYNHNDNDEYNNMQRNYNYGPVARILFVN